MITIGMHVVKKSRKPFENKEKAGIVIGFTAMTIPRCHSIYAQSGEMKAVEAVLLEGCKSPVRLSILEEAPNELCRVA